MTDKDAAPRWPAIRYEQTPWQATPDASLSRRRRLAARGDYASAVVPAIAHAAVSLDLEVATMVEDAVREIVAFDAELADQVAPFAALLLRSESAASSQIENLTVGAKRLFRAELGDRSSRNATLVASNVKAMRAAVDLADDMDVSAILAMHAALLEATDPETAGKFRDEPVWVGGTSPHTAMFVPPHHRHLGAAMADLVQFMRRTDVPALVQAAIAHAQFETIHPFPDGNGRTGRALVTAVLRRRGLARRSIIPLSSGLLADTGAYFNALGAYRQGDVRPITMMFAESTLAAIDNARLLAEDLTDLERSVYASLTGGNPPESVRWTVEFMLHEPALTADRLIEATGMSQSSAYRSIDRLVEAGALQASGNIGGRRVWVAPGVLEALDEFALRAGRRTRA